MNAQMKNSSQNSKNQKQTPEEKFKETIAAALGESPDQINSTNPQWLKLMKEGVLVSVHIGRWRAKTRLSWSDLGIELTETDDKELEKIITLGHKKLLPAKLLNELDSLESKARRWLEKKAYRTYWGLFVPVTAYQEWKEQHETYRTEYFQKLDQIIENYDQIINEVLVSYEAAARGNYNRLKMLHPEALKNFKSEEHFTKVFLENVQSHLVSAEKIKASFYFDIDLNYVPLPTLMAEEEAEKERIYQEQQLAAEKAWAEQKEIRDAAYAKDELHRIEINEARTASEAREKMLQEMNRDLIEKTRKEKEEKIDGFLKDVVVQLRGLVYEATTNVLDSLRKKDSLAPRSVVQLKNMIEQVKSLNFYGDQEIDQMISQVEIQVGQDSDNRDTAQIEGNLQAIATITRASLVGLGEQPRAARNLGISDNPSVEMVRTARQRLGLEQVEIPAMQIERKQRRLVEV